MLSDTIQMCADVFGVDASELSADTRMVDDLNISSMNAFMLAGQVKRRYKLKMSYKTARNFDTIGDLDAYIEEHISQ